MTPQELKNSILQLAIQGKLVEQRPEEGTAEELFAKVLLDNNVDGQRVKQKIITEITDDDKLFNIPENWTWIKLGKVCVIARGGSPRPIKNYLTTSKNGVNWIKIGDTEKNGKYISSTAEKIKPEGVSKSRMVHVGDFLLTNSMSFGRPYILKIDGCIHDGWLVISQNDKIFDQDYLYWMLSSSYAYTQFCGKVSGAVVKNLNSDKVANSVFPLPPLAEQKRIVAKIEELLPYIDRYEKAWNKLEQFNKRFPEDMKKSLLQYAIEGKLVEQRPEEGTGEELFRKIQEERQRLIREKKIKKEKPLPEITEEEKPFDIPENWKWVRLRDIISILGDGIHGTPNFDETGKYFFINGNNLVKGKIIIKADTKKVSNEEFEKYKKPLNERTILVSINGTIGNYSFYNGEPIILGKSACYFSLINGIDKEYICRVLNTKHFLDYAVKEATQTTIKNVSLKSMRMLPVPLPPLAEQKRIVEKLEQILPLCDNLSTKYK